MKNVVFGTLQFVVARLINFSSDFRLFRRNDRHLSCENFHLFGNLYCYCAFKLKTGAANAQKERIPIIAGDNENNCFGTRGGGGSGEFFVRRKWKTNRKVDEQTNVSIYGRKP